MIRHNPLDPNFTELPMVQGNTNRDWELRVPDYLVQNGFWYKVAGGDTETQEYKVSVRSLPLFTDFQATYDYPKYLRRKSETANDPIIKAYRGTVVTLVARTNRTVRDGTMTIEPGGTRPAYDLVFGKPESLRFVFKVTESGKYKLTFADVNGERNADPYQNTITVEADEAPRVVINSPEAEETALPTNGLLAIDGKVGDDFGVDLITLKMKLISPVERPLADRPFLNGKSPSFRRTMDDTWPTDVDYKDSVDLAKVEKDAAGLPLKLTPDMVIEYWLEAADNCTEPKANVGRSAPSASGSPRRRSRSRRRRNSTGRRKSARTKSRRTISNRPTSSTKRTANPRRAASRNRRTPTQSRARRKTPTRRLEPNRRRAAQNRPRRANRRRTTTPAAWAACPTRWARTHRRRARTTRSRRT